MKNKILGIVITYKETKFTEKAIKSLISAGVDVALVFNGWDESYNSWIDKLEQYLDFKFLNRANIGFCKGNNQAMKTAIEKDYDYVFLLNNDAWIEKDCIEELVKIGDKNENLGLLQPKVYKAWNKKLLDTTGLIFRHGNVYSWEDGYGYLIDRGENKIDENQYDEIQDILGCCGCSVLYKVKMLKEVGLFWEKLWSIFEDAELSWRAYKHGWKAKFVPEAIAYHWRGYTTNTAKSGNLNDDIKKLWKLLFYRNFSLTFIRHGNKKQKIYAALFLNYTGFRGFIGKRIGRNNIGGYHIWLSGLALINDRFLTKVDKEFDEMVKRIIEV